MIQEKINNQTVHYYESITEDFYALKSRHDIIVDEKYTYLPSNALAKFFSFIIYHLFAFPILGAYSKIKYGVKIEGKKTLKSLRDTGYVIYLNHTQVIDAFAPQVLLTHPKKTYMVASHDTLVNPFLSFFTKSLGSLPTPSTMKASINFAKSIKEVLRKKKVLVIYPEAHSWPYYTGIRDFSTTSFHFPVDNSCPAVPIAVTYRRPKRNGKKPKITYHIGEPIYPDPNLSNKENMKKMHDYVYDYMKKETSKESNYAYYIYKPISEKKDYIEKEKQAN